jgi:molybdopterin/thiamine biosynthesis adenylyltransferase
MQNQENENEKIGKKEEQRINDLFIRNIGTLSIEDQLTIVKTKIGIAGCGIGSEVARQLTRFGFTISALADPDIVEIHNLNRQSYHHNQVGKKKVEALLEKLKLINPDQKPELFPDGITKKNYKKFVDLCDIVVDGIDPSAINLSVAIAREAQRQNKHVVTALDFGFGARLFVFAPDGMDIMDFLKIDKNTTDEAMLKMPIDKIMASYMEDAPEYIWQILKTILSGELNYYPQNILAVAQSAVLIVTACKRVALNQPIVLAPKYVHIDTDLMLNDEADGE